MMRPLSRVFHAPPTARADESPAPPAAAEQQQAARAAAILGMPDGAMLRTLAGLGAVPDSGAVQSAQVEERAAAQQRIAQLIDAGQLDAAQLCASTANTEVLLCVAAMCRDAGCVRLALAGVDEQERARLAVAGATTRVRQAAAGGIEDPAVLAQLLTLARGKDKNVYKIVKQKCDEVRMQAQLGPQQAAEAEAATASLERHGGRIHDSIYAPSFEHFLERWLAAEPHAPPQLKVRALQAIERCREVIAEQARKSAQLAAEAAQAAARNAAHELASMQAAAEAQQRAARAEIAAAAAETLRRQEAEQQQQQAAAAALVSNQLGGLIGKALGALRDGNSVRAAGLRRAIEEKRAALAGTAEGTAAGLPAHMARQIVDIDIKLQELKAWKDYAVAPKRAALIAAMQDLIGSSAPVPQLAERIEQLQAEWQTISRGLVSDSDADWQLFHQAAESANQPCRVYFEAQAAARQANLDKRRAVLERLHKFENAQHGERPDWRSVAVVLREAPLEWRRAAPVERGAAAAIQSAFDACLQRLHSRLHAWHEDNAVQKQALIERAQRLCALDAARDAADGAKQLQVLWQEIGPATRERERKLWQQFREHCDAVFQKRQQAHEQHAAGLESARRAAAALCEQAEGAAAMTGSALREAAAGAAQWRAAFDALGELPRADQRRLHERFERALRQLRAQAGLQQTRDQERAYTDLLEAGRLIQVYGWALSQNAAAAECDATKQAAESHIANVVHWPKGSPAALAAAWTAAQPAKPAQAGPDAALQVQREQALRLLCIRAEICSETPTPAEDQQRRREYQVQRLLQGMGRGEQTLGDWATLAMAWVQVGPVAPDLQAALLARFMRCRTS